MRMTFSSCHLSEWYAVNNWHHLILNGTLCNKTKYFRLRLTDEVSSERPKRDLRETWDWPETDLRLTWDWPETDHRPTQTALRWRLYALDKLVPDGQTDRQTDKVTPWAPWRSQKQALQSSCELIRQRTWWICMYALAKLIELHARS